MQLAEVIEGVLAGEIAPVEAPTEEAWLEAWRAHGLGEGELEVVAARGGAHADRLAWVFLAAYQSAIYRTFPELPRAPGWVAFVNTEDRSGALSPAALSGEGDRRRLDGWKGWVAASDHVAQLVVSAGQDRPPFLLVARETPGVRIESREAAGYLPELSQGRAGFLDVPASEAATLASDARFIAFRTAEAAYIRVAVSAFLLAHVRRLEASPALLADAVAGLAGAVGVVRLPLSSPAAVVALAGVDAAMQPRLDAFEALLAERDPALLDSWTRDARLVRGATSRLAARAAEALGRAGESEG